MRAGARMHTHTSVCIYINILCIYIYHILYIIYIRIYYMYMYILQLFEGSCWVVGFSFPPAHKARLQPKGWIFIYCVLLKVVR